MSSTLLRRNILAYVGFLNTMATPQTRPMSRSNPVSSPAKHMSSTGHSQPSTSLPFKIIKPSIQAAPNTKTLVLLFGFYGAKKRALDKFSQLYFRKSFDVLCIESHLKHFAWPKQSLTLSRELLTFLEKASGCYDNIVVHAMSMGAYNYTVFSATMLEEHERYSVIKDKICAVIYYSVVAGNLQNMAIGVSRGITQNSVVQKLVPALMSLYFFATHSQTVTLYDHYLDIFRNRPLEVPTLLFCCENDPMSQTETVDEFIDIWRAKNTFPVTKKSWAESKHAAHLLVHEKEYLAVWEDFLTNTVGITGFERNSKL